MTIASPNLPAERRASRPCIIRLLPPAAARRREFRHHRSDDVCRVSSRPGGALRPAGDRFRFAAGAAVRRALVRHRRLRPRYLLAPDLWRAHGADHRLHLVLLGSTSAPSSGSPRPISAAGSTTGSSASSTSCSPFRSSCSRWWWWPHSAVPSAASTST